MEVETQILFYGGAYCMVEKIEVFDCKLKYHKTRKTYNTKFTDIGIYLYNIREKKIGKVIKGNSLGKWDFYPVIGY